MLYTSYYLVTRIFFPTFIHHSEVAENTTRVASWRYPFPLEQTREIALWTILKLYTTACLTNEKFLIKTCRARVNEKVTEGRER